jgi:LacI family transcriptional regulator
MSVQRPHVALIVETSKGFGRGLLLGIARYVRTHEPWSIYVDERSTGDPPPGWLRRWRGQGLIVRAHTPSVLRAVRALGVPVVHTLRQPADNVTPAVYSDDAAIARAVAAYLLERQFRNFAFVGVDGARWSRLRSQAFVAALAADGRRTAVYEPLSRRRFRASWEGGQDDLAEWIKQLPKPVGVMAAHDLRALCVLDACRRNHFDVPEQVAVVGVDNDEVLCELADPPLTSVAHQIDRLGYEAGALLERAMRGEPPPEAPLLLPPLEIVSRRSTDAVAINDSNVAAALRFIRERACGGVQVEQVCRHVGISRRALERGFARFFQSTPHEQILQVRIRRVQELLAHTDEPLEAIAKKSGFARAAYLSVCFRRETGQTPGEYRRQVRPMAANGL